MQHQQRDVLGWLAMAASVVVAAHGEWSLAVACGFGSVVAAALPVAIDAYAIRAMQSGREVLPAVLLMIATNAASHLHGGGQLPVSPWLVVAVSAIAPTVLWRVHALQRHPATGQGRDIEVSRPVPTEEPQQAPAPVNSQVTHGGQTPAAPVPHTVRMPEIRLTGTTREPVAICGGGHLPVPAVPERSRLGTAVARMIIESAWEEGLSVREAARRATRSTSQVQRVYAEMDAKKPITGQTEIQIETAAA